MYYYFIDRYCVDCMKSLMSDSYNKAFKSGLPLRGGRPRKDRSFGYQSVLRALVLCAYNFD